MIGVAVVLGLPGIGKAQSADGAYRGMFVCQKMPASPDILRVPLDVLVSGGQVILARPIFNWNGQRVLGSELATGTVDGEGKIHVTSNWFARGVTYQGDYSGTLTANGGTLSGTQSWSGERTDSASRACAAALVPAPKASTRRAAREH